MDKTLLLDNLWILLMVHRAVAHQQLLRRLPALQVRPTPCATPYHPGGLFELVSCPHYLAEIVIYAGLGLLIGAQRPLAWLILAWVVSHGRGRRCMHGCEPHAGVPWGRTHGIKTVWPPILPVPIPLRQRTWSSQLG